MNERKENSSDKALVIGCGHGRLQNLICGRSHPAKDFITIDIDSSTKPDIVANVFEIKAVQEKLDNKKFSSILFECFPGLEKGQHPLFLEDSLTEQGHVIFIDSGYKNLALLQNGSPFWFAVNKNGHNMIIIPKNEPSGPPTFTPAVKKYLSTHLDHKEPEKLVKISRMNPELKSFLKKLYSKECRDMRISNLDEFFIQKFITDGAPRSPPTIKQIQDIINSYKPGKFRNSFFGKKTKGMEDLKSFLKDKTELTTQDLINLHDIIQARETRLVLNKNPTRDRLGETTRVFREIAVLIDVYLISHHGKTDLEKKISL